MAYDSWQELRAYLLGGHTRDEELLRYEIGRELNYLREPYFQCIREVAPPCEVLDYQCGIGSDGLRLATMGYTPIFADEPGLCLDYLDWRLRWRGIEARVYGLDDAPRTDLAVCLTTLDRMPPLERLAELGRLVALGLGPLLPDKVDEVVQEMEARVSAVYRLDRRATFNVNWLFIAFETPEPIRAQEETDG